MLLRWLIAPERATPATWWPPQLGSSFIKSDGKHREEPAEVGLASGQGKSEAVLEALMGGALEGLHRLGSGCERDLDLPDASHQDKSMFPTCPALMECFNNISIC